MSHGSQVAAYCIKLFTQMLPDIRTFTKMNRALCSSSPHFLPAFHHFPFRLESKAFFLLSCQRSVNISKYCISPSVGITSYVGLENEKFLSVEKHLLFSRCGGGRGVLHVWPSVVPSADILESLMWRWNPSMTTEYPFEFAGPHLFA